eukprot:TRINITY_DN2493_c0_g1_i3.p1 TRINITY_DN2493_c0_g1~~TRINITY_DN2493_c0_g1_i3.p1  ORF type:complete len:304 (+),score=50.42 TRINITY_DN2493_c0_g1_i3:500-1411(+)
MATYGHSFDVSKAKPPYPILTPSSGPGAAGFCTDAKGTLAYYEVLKLLSEEGTTTYYNDSIEAVESWAASGDPKWVGYDNEQSIIKKVEFLKANKLGGAMFWSLDMDDFVHGYPLLSAANNALNGACTKNCNNHGLCQSAKCVCDLGWTGDECAQCVCPGSPSQSCSGHGKCSGCNCICEPGWTGPACSVDNQPQLCTYHVTTEITTEKTPQNYYQVLLDIFSSSTIIGWTVSLKFANDVTVSSCWGDAKFEKQEGNVVTLVSNAYSDRFIAGTKMKITCGSTSPSPPSVQTTVLNGVTCPFQ